MNGLTHLVVTSLISSLLTGTGAVFVLRYNLATKSDIQDLKIALLETNKRIDALLLLKK